MSEEKVIVTYCYTRDGGLMPVVGERDHVATTLKLASASCTMPGHNKYVTLSAIVASKVGEIDILMDPPYFTIIGAESEMDLTKDVEKASEPPKSSEIHVGLK